MKILMVDDTPDNIVLLKALLTRAGYSELLTASNASEAYSLLELSNPAAPPAADLILMDILMPDINGIAACRNIKMDARYQDTPVIMVTANTDMESLEDAFKAGAMDYIVKPLRKIELLTRTRSALKLKEETDCRKQREQELQKRNQELEAAAEEIKLLQGFIPICSYCKKIRDMQGQWRQMEAYLHKHTRLQFSHGICDPCLKTEFGKMDKMDEDRKAS